MSLFTILSIILAALAGFIVFWAGVVSFVGFMGWKPLADQYPAARWPEGEEGKKLSWQSGSIGQSNYNSALNAVLTPDGLYLKPVALFKYNHDPVFIPWSAVDSLDKGWFNSLKLGLDGGKRMTVRGRFAKEIQKAYDGWVDTVLEGEGTSDTAQDGLLDLDTLMGPDGDTISEGAQSGSGWRQHRTR